MENLDADDFKAELSIALKNCGLSDQQPSNREALLRKIHGIFVDGNPRAWWTSLKEKPIVFQYEDDSGYLHLAELAPSSTRDVWFVVDEGDEEKFIFDAPIQAISEVIKECRFFEYYVVPKDFSWMLAENDHGDLLFVTSMTDAVRR
ncbi:MULTISPECIES: DUF6756 family protein [Burkholderia]|jgi:hypothetical protein|uniref:DUF6756 family protein n=3 Tax=Pseudomonadota TaxID=1224 RepID=UPI00158BB45E|nr:DUF6756 family protein [Burkholderia ambifaria]MBR8062609.1 hypothetical protein [Burkholderia ambifaria]